MHALYNEEDRMYYHEECAPQAEADSLTVVDVDGFVCDSCGSVIEDKDEEPAKTLEEEEEP